MNFKQLNIFDKLLFKDTMLQFPFNSSAMDFEDQIRPYVTPPVQLYHEYMLPNKKTPQEYEYLVQKLVYLLLIFDPQELTDTTNFYVKISEDVLTDAVKMGASDERLAQITNHYVREIEKVEKILAPLDAAARQDLVDQIESRLPDARAMAVDQVKQLKRLNPQLERVRVDMTRDLSIADFLQGVNYGFAPEEIDYFLNTKMEDRNREIDESYRKLAELGLEPTYIVRPDRAQKIVDAVTRARQKQLIAHNRNSNGL
ncbi:hypothetical protein HDR63_03775 [bacterium]|nr:hypothetical protein [bacterium]